jgi:hypothetical protein
VVTFNFFSNGSELGPGQIHDPGATLSIVQIPSSFLRLCRRSSWCFSDLRAISDEPATVNFAAIEANKAINHVTACITLRSVGKAAPQETGLGRGIF